MARLISKTRFAQVVGVSKAAITQASKLRFPGAVRGNDIDLDHIEAQLYLQKRGVDPTAVAESLLSAPKPPTTLRPAQPEMPPPAPAKPAQAPSLSEQYRADRKRLADERARTEATGVNDDEIPDEDVTAFGEWTLNRITRTFKTAKGFVLWLDARKRMSDIHEKDIRIAERTGRLIARDFVRTHVFSHLDALARRFLTDMPATLARKIYAAARANVPIEQAEAMLRDAVSTQLQQAKSEIVRALAQGDRDEHEHAA